jgi:geranylgeranyl diphosphate synthase type I
LSGTLTINEYVRGFKEILEPFTDNYLSGLVEAAMRSDPRIAELYEVFREASRGGKCIRGSLVKLGYEIASGRSARDAILPVAAAFEILQTAILGHDDVIDKSPLRRGRDSIWRAISRRMEQRRPDQYEEAYHFGISEAICLGDIGIFLANRLVAESSIEHEKRTEAMRTFLDAQLNMVDGEMLDALMSFEKDYDDVDGIIKMASLKTAWYTIIGPLQVGAVLGGAVPEQLDAMKRYGIALGLAFQLKDDILGIEAEEEESGKSNTSDIAEGKITLLAHFAMKRAAPEQLAQLRLVYGSSEVSDEARQIVRDIFESTGAFAETEKIMENCLAEAKAVITDITRDPEKTRLLEQLCDMMIRRKS